MRFLVDEQLPSALARWITARGHEAEHVFDVGLGGAGDVEIWRYAERAKAIIFTKDQDFVALARMDTSVGIVWLRSGNLPRRELLVQMDRVFDEVCEALASGENIVEVGD
jgi:predicted nuclease of predicted toxin-antitoxin system